MELFVDLRHGGIHRLAARGDEVAPRNPAPLESPKLLGRADLDAEHRVAHPRIPIVQRLVERADAQEDVVVFRPRAARQQLLDVIIQRPPSLRLTDALRVDILVVEIERHLVFPPFEHLGECRNAIVGHVSVAVDQPEPLQLLVGVVGHAPLAVGRAVDRQVVHEHHHAVLREAEIDLEKGRHHRQGFLARLDAVFGIAGHHAAAMAADDNVPLGVVAEIGFEVFKTIDLNGVKPFLRRGTLLRDGGK